MRNGLDGRAFFLGAVFLLFPIAHIKGDFFGLPLYLAEIPLILLTLFILFTERGRCLTETRDFFSANKALVLGVVVFLLGVVLSYSFNEKTLTGLGMQKSFFFFPILLAFLLVAFPYSLKSTRFLLWFWLAGLAGAAWVSLIIASYGWLTFDGRLAGLYTSPNYLAMLLTPGILLSLYFFLIMERKILRFGSLSFLFLIALVLVLTQSYGAMASTFFATTFFILLTRNESNISIGKILGTVFIMLIVSIFVIAPTQKFEDTLLLDERSSLSSRLIIWQSALHIARDSFPLGIGPGNFQTKYLEYQQYYPPYLEWAVPQPHNLFLAFFLQTGAIGLSGFLLILIVLARGWRKRWQQKNLSREERLLGALLISLFAQVLLHGLVDTPYFKNDLAFAFWGGIGLLAAWAKNTTD